MMLFDHQQHGAYILSESLSSIRSGGLWLGEWHGKLVHGIGTKISFVWPYDRAMRHSNRFEVSRIAQGLEDRAI